MADLVSSKLDLLTEKARAQKVSWERNEIPSSDSNRVQKLVSLSNSVSLTKSQQADSAEDVQSQAQFLAKLLSDLKTVDALSAVLALIGDLLATNSSDASTSLLEGNAAEALAKSLVSKDDFVKLKSAAILSLLVAEHPEAIEDQIVYQLLEALVKLLQANTISDADEWDSDNQAIALQCLALVCKSSESRLLLWHQETSEGTPDKSKCVLALLTILRTTAQATKHTSGLASGTATPRTGSSSVDSNPATAPQMQYYLGLALWILSYERQVADELNETYPQLIGLLTQLAKTATKEKVVRVVLATFRNLVISAPAKNLPAMLSAKLLPYLNQIISAKRWSDDEVKEDAAYLKDQLVQIRKTLTTYDEYAQELNSGQLEWSNPTHEDEDFWRENASKLEAQNKQGLKALVSVLKTTADNKILSIACNDLSMYLKYSDPNNGRKYVSELGGKIRVMELMTDKYDAEVKFRALQAVSRLVTFS